MSDQAGIAAANARRADDVVAALVRHGVDLVFVCPGSRSTPLVLALARRGLRTEVLLDERVAGFAALGAGRSGHIAAVLTTSGTAVANLLPACAEGARDGVPLVCVTADRSDADVAAGASQSLPQPPLLAGSARAVVDLPAPDGVRDVEGRAALDGALDRALQHLVGVGAGPVHLNVRFDKPLEPPPGWQLASSSSGAPSSSLSRTMSTLPDLPAGLVVVGALPRGLRAPVARLLARLGWPVIVDVASGVVVPAAVPRLPTVALRAAAVREALAPASVLWLGGLMTEDVTATWVAGLRRRGARVVQLQGSDVRRDPFGLMDEVHVVDADALDALAHDWPRADGDLVVRVQHLAAAVTTTLAALDGPDDGAGEPGIARLVTQAARPGSLLFVGNSMPIRDVDRFGAPLADDVELLVNRGVAGIDGNLATALGASLASGRPGLVLLGDLAALHDLSGLAAIASARAPLRIVVVNNAGGGIFSFLPVEGAVDAATHERFWGTPHAHALAPVARALGLAADVVADGPALRERLAAPITGPELLEVRTNRADNVVRHRALDRALESACARALS
jgi:2-succinyl-5-enolpyruvyl-6-hydroxy-3-cyclohexene-1-carboxylate synthase